MCSSDLNGNLLGLTSSYTTSDGAKHDMADVWFTKDSSASNATGTTASAPSLGDLLSAPPTELLPGGEKAHVAPVHDTSHATAAMIHGLANARRLDEDEPGRHTPLI